MKRRILVAMAIFAMAFFDGETVQAEEYEILTTAREEYVIEDEAYQIWKQAQKPAYQNVVIGDYSDLFIYETVDIDMLQYLYQYMDRMPENTISYLRENEWKVNLVPKAYMDNVYVSGYSEFDEKNIWISLETKNDIGMTLTHEIGHVVFRELIAKGKNQYMISVQIDEVYFHDGMNCPYIYFRTEESIAQSFYEYIFYPLELQGGTPEIFQMFNEVCYLY